MPNRQKNTATPLQVESEASPLPPSTSTPSPILHEILAQVKALQQIPATLEKMQLTISEINSNLKSLQTRMEVLEEKIQAQELMAQAYNNETTERRDNVVVRLEGAEAQIRRKNLKVLGITQVEAKTQPELLQRMDTFFREVLELGEDFPPLDIEHVRQSFVPRREGNAGYVFIVQFLHPAVGDRVLKECRTKSMQAPIFGGEQKDKVAVFPNYAKDILEARRWFNRAKTLAKE